MARDLHSTIDAVWRIEAAKIIGAVARMVRDVGLAEELAQDALVAALEHWPKDGIPDNPAAWLMATAKNRALDRLRQEALRLRKQQELGADADARGDHVTPDFSDALDDRDTFGDDLLRLVFTACHPVLSKEAQVALTLRLLGGLTTEEIARAHLVPEATIAQRIVRAKRTLTAARVPFEVPQGDALSERLAAVLEVIYLIFNEGYSATAGDHWMRPALCEEALRLGRVLAQLAPNEAEVHGLVALMEIQASRIRARTDPAPAPASLVAPEGGSSALARPGPSLSNGPGGGRAGRPILLLDQDRGRWDYVLIGRGLAALQRAAALGRERGPYELQAAIAACHARARTADETDWPQIVALYDALSARVPSPVIELNRAVAVSMAFGPEAALPLVDTLANEPVMQRYHLMHSVRADLLAKLGRIDEAREALERAAELTSNEQERQLLEERRQGLTRH